jgi:acetyltransferase
MAFAAFERERDGPIIGVARLVFDPNFENAEYAIIVRTDRQGRGLGRRLVRDLIDYGRARGGNRLWGDVVSENARMLDLTRRMGARCELIPRGGVTRTWFDLGQSA